MTPLAYVPHGDGQYVVVGANGGSPRHPRWCDNLKANPKVDVEVGTERFTVRAEELHDPARAELWPKIVAAAPSVSEFATKTARQFPVFVLTRVR